MCRLVVDAVLAAGWRLSLSEVGRAAAVGIEWSWAGCHSRRMTGQAGVSGMSVILPCCSVLISLLLGFLGILSFLCLSKLSKSLIKRESMEVI